MSGAMAWNSNAEYSHGKVAQGRSGDGIAKIRGAKAWKEERSKAKAWKGVVSQRQSGAERSVLGHGWYCLSIMEERRETMKKCSKGIKILAIVYVAVVLAIIAATAVEAKEPTFKSLYVPEGEWHNGGHIFIVKNGVVQTGWTTYNGHLYYCHKTASEKYPIGAVTRGEIRTVGGNRWVAFNEKGWRVTKDQYIAKGPHRKAKVLEFDRNGYLKYIYNTDMSFRNFRYSLKEHRRQEQNNGKWESVGMQYYPDCVDWQK